MGWQINAASLMGWHTAMPLHCGNRRVPLQGCNENCVFKEFTSKQKENSMRDHRAVASPSSHCVHTSITHAHIRVMSTALEEQQHFYQAVVGPKPLRAPNRSCKHPIELTLAMCVNSTVTKQSTAPETNSAIYYCNAAALCLQEGASAGRLISCLRSSSVVFHVIFGSKEAVEP